MFKKNLFLLMCLLFVVFIGLCVLAVKQTKTIHRDPAILMNKYYRLKTSDPMAAKRALDILLTQDQNYVPALEEASQWLLHGSNKASALPILKRLHALLPTNPHYSFQLAYLYYERGNWIKARPLFMDLTEHAPPALKRQAHMALSAMNSYVANYQYSASIDTFSVSLIPPVNFPVQKASYQDKPVSKMSQHVKQGRQEILYWLKNEGYHALAKGQRSAAIDYFTRAYQLTYDPNIAMQLGYLYDQCNDKPKAYQYFQRATKNPDKHLALKAESAMTNLGYQQTKALPAPYFSETFFTPFSQSRFGLTVRPFLTRLGIEQENRIKSKEYLLFRRTDDNRSANLGQISQIYEDDVQIMGGGAQITPFKDLPIVGYIEAGEAYDLVYRNRNRWRGDLRAGVMYYNQFGCRPEYVATPSWGHDYFGDLYGDATYFSRYNNNVIGGVRTHQGIRVLQYHSSLVNVYVTGRVIADVQRIFYNNFAEVGPGIAFIPTNRFNVQLRFEHLNGVYLPAGAIPNPYGHYYTNNLVQLLFYVKV